MGWLKRIFGWQERDRLERLVRRLLFYQHEGTVLEALREATSLAPKGDDLGVRALTEAIRRRCGGREIAFYAPGIAVRSGDVLFEAENRLLELVASGKLLADPAETQNLMSAAFSVSQDGLRSLISNIFVVGGADQAYDFQLLFNQMQSSAKLRFAQEEGS